MQSNNTDQLTQLHKAFPCISMETLEELTRRGLLHIDAHTWRFGDESNGTTRRLDGRKWRLKTGEQVKAFADNKDAEWHRLVGLHDVIENDRQYALLAIEGSKDALAAAEFAFRIGHLSDTGIMCALGSGYRPIPSEMHKLAGRWVVLIGDNDESGTKTTQLVSFALNTAGVRHCIWDWELCHIKATDFFQFMMKVPVGSVKNPLRVLYNGTFLSSSPPSQNSPVQQFSSSTQVPTPSIADVIGVTIEQFVIPYVVKKKGTSNRKSFDLARAIKNANENTPMNELSNIHDEWFTKSQAALPKDAARDEYFRTFLKQLNAPVL